MVTLLPCQCIYSTRREFYCTGYVLIVVFLHRVHEETQSVNWCLWCWMALWVPWGLLPRLRQVTLRFFHFRSGIMSIYFVKRGLLCNEKITIWDSSSQMYPKMYFFVGAVLKVNDRLPNLNSAWQWGVYGALRRCIVLMKNWGILVTSYYQWVFKSYLLCGF